MNKHPYRNTRYVVVVTARTKVPNDQPVYHRHIAERLREASESQEKWIAYKDKLEREERKVWGVFLTLCSVLLCAWIIKGYILP